METSKGKLVNTDTGKELAFAMNPSDYTLSRDFLFSQEPCLVQSAPVVAFQAGAAATLSFQVTFDRDADRDADPKNVMPFLKDLNKVDDGKKSVGLCEFRMGSLYFKGYITSYTYHATRFDNEGSPVGVVLSVKMLSNGEFENA